MYLPSHSNSMNERNERRQNRKNENRIIADAQKPKMTTESAKAKFAKMAAASVASGKVSASGNVTRVAVGNGSKFYPIYKRFNFIF